MTVGSEPRDAVAPGEAAAWADIATSWRERDYRTLHELAERVLGPSVGRVDDLFDGEVEPDDETIDAALAGAFAAAGSSSERVLVAFYVYAACLDKWERSADYELIRRVVRALEEKSAESEPDDGSEGLLALIVAQATAIGDEMAVESGLNCSCPTETRSRAERVVRQMDDIVDRLGSRNGELTEIARRDAEMQRTYFDAVAKAAAVVATLGERGADPRPRLNDVIEQLEGAEHALRGDVYESELRAHRLTLAELVQAADRPQLHVDRAELVYIYPFALDGFDRARVDERIHQDLRLEAIGGEPIEVHPLQLNDLWGQPDRAEYVAGYGGAFVELPPIIVRTTASTPGEQTIRFEAEVRLSRLGNHYLRVATKLVDRNLHRVNQALRRGSRCMGEEELESNGRRWRRFMDYATDVIASVGKALEAEAIGDPRANFHVLLAARAISVREPGGEARPAGLDDLEQAVGSSLLFHPLPGLATALEEWIRYPAPNVRASNLLDQGRYADEIAVRTANTTILYMPSSPEWRTAGYEQMIEFVASVPPLLLLWDRQANGHAERLESVLAHLGDGDGVGDVELSKLHHAEAELRRREADLRQDRGFLHSPALCRDRTQREFIDSLWEAAGLPLVEADLDRQLSHLSRLQERASAIAAALSEERRRDEKERSQTRARRIEKYIQLAGLVLAVASLAEVVSLINGGFEHHRWGLIAIETLLLTALSIVVLAYLFLKLRANE